LSYGVLDELGIARPLWGDYVPVVPPEVGDTQNQRLIDRYVRAGGGFRDQVGFPALRIGQLSLCLEGVGSPATEEPSAAR
jgi:hypothetical protein